MMYPLKEMNLHSFPGHPDSKLSQAQITHIFPGTDLHRSHSAHNSPPWLAPKFGILFLRHQLHSQPYLPLLSELETRSSAHSLTSTQSLPTRNHLVHLSAILCLPPHASATIVGSCGMARHSSGHRRHRYNWKSVGLKSSSSDLGTARR